MTGYILFLIARTFAVVSSPLGVGYSTIRRLHKGEPLGKYYFNNAYVLDVYINSTWGDFLNDVFGKNNKGYKYGNPNESLSRVLGKNKELGTLTKGEAWVAKQLNRIDPNHVEKAAK